jgi:hypothetical protein
MDVANYMILKLWRKTNTAVSSTKYWPSSTSWRLWVQGLVISPQNSFVATIVTCHIFRVASLSMVFIFQIKNKCNEQIWHKYIYVGPRIPDMYPLHIGILDMRDATLPLCTITATTLLCFWPGRIKILKHISS